MYETWGAAWNWFSSVACAWVPTWGLNYNHVPFMYPKPEEAYHKGEPDRPQLRTRLLP